MDQLRQLWHLTGTLDPECVIFWQCMRNWYPFEPSYPVWLCKPMIELMYKEALEKSINPQILTVKEKVREVQCKLEQEEEHLKWNQEVSLYLDMAPVSPISMVDHPDPMDTISDTDSVPSMESFTDMDTPVQDFYDDVSDVDSTGEGLDDIDPDDPTIPLYTRRKVLKYQYELGLKWLCFKEQVTRTYQEERIANHYQVWDSEQAYYKRKGFPEDNTFLTTWLDCTRLQEYRLNGFNMKYFRNLDGFTLAESSNNPCHSVTYHQDQMIDGFSRVQKQIASTLIWQVAAWTWHRQHQRQHSQLVLQQEKQVTNKPFPSIPNHFPTGYMKNGEVCDMFNVVGDWIGQDHHVMNEQTGEIENKVLYHFKSVSMYPEREDRKVPRHARQYEDERKLFLY